MKALFLITVLGCSDDMSLCDAIQKHTIAAASMAECDAAARTLVSETRVDYPTASYDCAPLDAPEVAPSDEPADWTRVAGAEN